MDQPIPTPSATDPVPVPAPKAPATPSHRGTWIYLFVLILVVLVGWWWSASRPTSEDALSSVSPSVSASPAADDFSAELRELEDINVDEELKGIDAELNQL